MTYKEAKAKLGDKPRIKLANNTWLERRNDKTIAIRYHDTDVVIFTPHYVELQSGGWYTPTTLDRMRLSPVYVSSGGKRGWGIYLRKSGNGYWPDWDNEYVYFDGIRVSPNGDRLMKNQPNRPKNLEPVITRSGFTGLTRSESRREMQKRLDMLFGRSLAPDKSETIYIEGNPVVRNTYHFNPRNCKFLIMVPEHYRPDGSCRCNDPYHSEMKEWGYKWNEKTGEWTADNA